MSANFLKRGRSEETPEPEGSQSGLASGFAEVEAMRRNAYQIVKTAPRDAEGNLLAPREAVSLAKKCWVCGTQTRSLTADRLGRWACGDCHPDALIRDLDD